MDKKFKDMSLQEKFAYVLTVIIMSILLLGSVGGLFYLFSPKEPKTASAEELSFDYSVSIPVIWQFDSSRYIINGEVTTLSDIPSIAQSIRVYSNNGLYIDYRSIVNGEYTTVTQPLLTSAEYLLDFAISSTQNLRLSLTAGASNGPYTFNNLVLVYYQSYNNSNSPITFTCYDNNGNIIVLSFYLSPLGQSYTFYDSYGQQYYRKYSTISDISNTFGDISNSAYNDGYDKGYKKGFDEGKSYGESVGYLKGTNDSEQFTWAKLLDAVFYAPLKAFTSLFNFEILGVNLLSVVSFILTVCLVVGILKWVV